MRTRPMLTLGSALAIVSICWLLLTGAGFAAAFAVTLVLAVQTAGGAFIWSLIRARSGRTGGCVESLGLGFALGSVMAMASGVALGRWIPGGWGWAVPSVIAGVLWVGRRRRTRVVHQVRDWDPRSVVGLAVGGVLGLVGAATNIARYPLTSSGPIGSFHPDMLFFEGLANSLARFGPSESIFMAGTDLRYHWFTYAWIGEISQSLGLQPFLGLTRVLPLAAALAAAGIAAAWARRCSTTIWVPTLAAALVTAGGYLGAAYGTLLNFDSPSQALTTVWMLALAAILLEYLDGGLPRSALWIVAMMAAACMGGKASAAIVMLAALGLALALSWLRHLPWRRRAGAALIAAGVPGAATYLLVLTGSSSPGDLLLFTWDYRASSVQGLNLGGQSLGIAAGTVILMLAIVPRWAGLGGFWLDTSQRWSPTAVVGAGLAAVSLCFLAVLSQGVNDLWFALSASAPLAVISAIGLGVAWQVVERGSPGGGEPAARSLARAQVLSAVAGLGVFAVVSIIWARGETGTVSIRAIGPPLGILLAAAIAVPIARTLGARRLLCWFTVAASILVLSSTVGRGIAIFGRLGSQSAITLSDAPAIPGTADQLPTLAAEPAVPAAGEITVDYGNSWSPLEVEAALFLRDHSTDDEIVVTDHTVSSLIPALTTRRTFMSAVNYETLYARPSASSQITYRASVSERLGGAPAKEDLALLCAAGVTWAWIATAKDEPQSTWLTLADRTFTNEAVTLYHWSPDDCSAIG